MGKGLSPIVMVIILIVGFIGAVAVSYFLMPNLAPEYTVLPPEPIKDEIPLDNSFDKYNYLEYGPSKVQSLQRQVDSLANIVTFRKENRMRFVSQIAQLETEKDSLIALNATKDEIIYQLETKADTIRSGALDKLMASKQQVSSEKVKQTAADLSKLDEETLKGILTSLTEEEIIQIYNATEVKKRDKILKSLDPEMAARVIKKVLL